MRPPPVIACALLLLLHAGRPYAPAGTDSGDEAERWMRQMRAYPFGTIPAGARRAAWESMRQLHSAATTADVQPAWRTRGQASCSVSWGWGFETGRIYPVAISPVDPSVVLVGSASGGIWRSEDGGTTFTPVSDDQAELSIGTIAFAPNDPSIVYAGMGSDFYGTGILKSTDGGRHWHRLGSPSSSNAIRKIVVDPGDANHLWASDGGVLEDDGSFGPAGLLVSSDGGAHWTTTFHGRPDSLVMHPSKAATLYMTAREANDPGQTPGAFRSTDGGRTWTSIYSGPYAPDKFPILRLDISRMDPRTLYLDWWATVGTTLTAKLLRSGDGGDTWSEIATSGLPAERPTFIAVDPHDAATVYLGLRDLYKSIDGGATWTNLTRRYSPTGAFTPIGSAAHEDQRDFAFSADGTVLYAATDGGLFRSRDNGRTFEALGSNLRISQLYSVAAHPANPAAVFAGTQDNGLQRADNAAGAWSEISTGDFRSIFFDGAGGSRLLANYIHGVIYRWRLTDGRSDGAIADDATFGEPSASPRMSFLAPMAQQRRTGRIYFGTWRLFVSSDFGTTWKPTAGSTTDLTAGGTDTLTAIAASESDDTIYTGSAHGVTNVSHDAGVTWSSITAGLPNRAIAAFAIDPASPAIVYVALSGYRTSHVFRSSDSGATWTDFSAGLPDIPVNAFRLDGSTFYAGTDLGVFRHDAASGQWEPFNNALPPVVVMGFDITADHRLLIATYGRGVYELATPGARRRAAGR